MGLLFGVGGEARQAPADALSQERRERSKAFRDAALSLARAFPADLRQQETRWVLHRDGVNLALAALLQAPEGSPPDFVLQSTSDEALSAELGLLDVAELRAASAQFSAAALEVVANAHELVLRAITPPSTLGERLEKYAAPLATAGLALLTLAALWAHRYPAGVDFPQHANLISIIDRLISGRGTIELENLYRFDWFTPYAVTYAVGATLSVMVGPLIAMKCLLTVFAFGTWYGLARWLKTIGSDPAWAVIGLPIFFGYVYLWGFLANCFALPVVFLYLAAVERTLAAPTRRDGFICLLWGLLLFFTHGIAFGLAMLVTGARLLMTPRLRAWLAVVPHLVPLAALTLFWMANQPALSDGPRGWVDKNRLISLFSGLFETMVSPFWAKITVALMLAAIVIARPRLNRRGGPYVAFAIALAAFVGLPEWVSATWLVANRMNVFVYGFFLGMFAPSLDRPNKLFLSRSVGRALAIGLMVVLNVRIASFNREVAGMDTLAQKIPKGSDVMQLSRWTDQNSPTIGPLGVLHMPAWVTALNGGVEHEDTAVVFQMPVRRRSAAFPQWYEYGLARGTLSHATAMANAHMGPARYAGSAGEWHLFHRPPQHYRGLLLVRAIQDWGTLELDRNVTKGPLQVGGRQYLTGLGTHANAWIRVRATRSGRLTGSCGVDDHGARALGSAVRCVIMNDARQVKFDSGPLQASNLARSFDVPMNEGEELVLEARALSENINEACVDWVELQLR